MSDAERDAAWRRAVAAMNTGRTDHAIPALHAFLALAPDHALGHAALAQFEAIAGDAKKATETAQRAVGLDPELPFAHYALAFARDKAGERKEALPAVRRAIELAPDDPDHHALLAKILMNGGRWKDGLAAADAALALDPHHADALNLRSLALVETGRAAEAAAVADAALAHDPDNAWFHQSRGRALLHQGDVKSAFTHFREALRLDPELDEARDGIVEALKARNPLYRPVLRFRLWISRLSPGRTRQVLAATWVAMLISRRIARGEGYDGVAYAIGMVWFGTMLFTACASPFFDLLLLLHPLGRHALRPHARTDALLLGGALTALTAAVAAMLTSDAAWATGTAMFFLFFLLPVSGIGSVTLGWPRRVMQGFAAVALAVFAWWLVQVPKQIELAPTGGVVRVEGDPPRVVGGAMGGRKPPNVMTVPGVLAVACALSSWFVLAFSGRRR